MTISFIFTILLLILFSINLSNSGLSRKRLLVSFSVIYSFLQLKFRLMNHRICFITLFLVNIRFCVFLSSPSQAFSLYLITFVWHNTKLFWKWKLGFISKYNLAMYLNVFLNYLSNIKCYFVMSFDYYNISFKKWEIWIIYLKLKEFSCKKKKRGKTQHTII